MQNHRSLLRMRVNSAFRVRVVNSCEHAALDPEARHQKTECNLIKVRYPKVSVPVHSPPALTKSYACLEELTDPQKKIVLEFLKWVVFLF